MKKTVYGVALIVALGMSGCSVKTAPIVEYNLKSTLTLEPLEKTECMQKSLKVAQPFSSKSLESNNMNYRVGGLAEYTFSQSQWTQSPNKTIAEEIVQTLRASKIFKNVQLYKSRAKTDYILETDIEEFIQHFSADEKSSYTEVVLHATLIDYKTSSVVDSKKFRAKVDVNKLSAEGGVDALSTAVSKILVQNVEWLHGVCR